MVGSLARFYNYYLKIMEKETAKKEITHWSPVEELNYHFFLVCKADQLLSNKSKAQGFYV